MKTTRQRIIRSVYAFALLAIAGYIALFIYETRPTQIVGNLLRIDRVPASLREAECESPIATDVLTTCVFQIDPADFAALGKGWRFVREPAGGGSYSYSGGPKIGLEFPVAVAFGVNNPPEMPHGGRISLVTDATRSRVQVDYYEE